MWIRLILVPGGPQSWDLLDPQNGSTSVGQVYAANIPSSCDRLWPNMKRNKALGNGEVYIVLV